MTVFLQIFLAINLLIIGALVTLAIQHALAHFKPKRDTNNLAHQQQNLRLPAEARERLLKDSQIKFQTAVNHSADELQRNLSSTSEQLNKLIEKLGTEIVENELQRYRADLEQIRKRIEVTLGSAQTDLTKHQTELKAKLGEEVAAEKQMLIKQIDTKLGDAVASFLTETLQHNIDLGTQTPYLTALLEEHKADFIKELGNEA